MNKAKPEASTTLAVRLVCVLCLLGILSPVESQRGYDIVDDQIVIESRRHWEQWRIPTHLARVEQDGSVRSREFRTVFNVLDDKSFGRLVQIDDKEARIANLDSTLRRDILGEPLKDAQDNLLYDYLVRPGVSRAGSNAHLAARIVDGDPTTFWEPNPRDPLGDWWVEVDLGRLVPLERLRLKFVEEGLGDPFLKFLLLLSPRQLVASKEDRTIGFSSLVPFEGSNTDQRVFTFDSPRVSSELAQVDPGTPGRFQGEEPVAILTESNISPEWTGRLVETVRIVITDTRGARAEQVTEEAWNTLLAGERGDVVYFVRDISGHEEPVDESTYSALEPERQGRRDFYRRELPRLAEVEAWGWGDNLALGLVEGGGSLKLTVAGKTPALAFDGSYKSYYSQNNLNPQDPEGNVLTVDIGGSVWLDQVRFVSSNGRGYVMRGSAGDRGPNGKLNWQVISPLERETNLDHGFYRNLTDLMDPVRKIRFLDLVTMAHNREGITTRTDRFWMRLFEIMLFSKGPPAEVVIESDLIEPPGLVTLGAVSWETDAAPNTEVEIRTRTGDQLIQRILYFDKTGNPKTAKEYKKLLAFLKGPSDTSFVAGPGWSAWSQKYLASGDLVTSPSRRRFMQIQARLFTHDRQAVPELRNIKVQLHAPLAQSLAAEVWPEEAQAGVLDTFEIFVQPTFLERPFDVRSLGFDEMLVRAEPGLDMRLVDVAVGTEAELSQERPTLLFDLPQEGGMASATGEVLQSRSQGDSLWLRFPEPVQSASPDVLSQIYYRQLAEEEEVPTGLDGELLTVNSHAQLPPLEQGAVRYFRLVPTGDEVELEEVDQASHEALPPAEQGPIRYFRKVVGLGNQSLFDTRGDTLGVEQFNLLSSAARGWVVGRGRLVRLRLVSTVFLHGTQLQVAVRHSGSEAPWQGANAEDATALRPAQTLSIGVQKAGDITDALTLTPNPFTPNGDGINDVVQIEFSLFKIYAARPLSIRIFSLDGRPVRSMEEMALGGRQRFAWDGRDDGGDTVAPGLYICQIEAETDADDVGGQRRSHLVAVAY